MTNGGFGVLGTSDDATGVYGLSGSEIGVFGAGRLEWKDTGNIMESVEQGMAATVWLEYMGKVLSTMEYTESGTLEFLDKDKTLEYMEGAKIMAYCNQCVCSLLHR